MLLYRPVAWAHACERPALCLRGFPGRPRVALSRVSDPPGLGRRRVGVREPRWRLIGGRYTKNVTILPDLERVHHTTHHYRVVAAKYNPRQNRTENLVFMCHTYKHKRGTCPSAHMHVHVARLVALYFFAENQDPCRVTFPLNPVRGLAAPALTRRRVYLLFPSRGALQPKPRTTHFVQYIITHTHLLTIIASKCS